MSDVFATDSTGFLFEPGTAAFTYTIPLTKTLFGEINTMPGIVATMTINGAVMILSFHFEDDPLKIMTIAHTLGSTTIATIVPAVLPYSLNYVHLGPADFIITITRNIFLGSRFVGQYIYTFNMVHEDVPLLARFLVPIILGRRADFDDAIIGTRTNSTRVHLPTGTIIVR